MGPAGFRLAKTPKTMNPVRMEIGGHSALMSLIHVLVIPTLDGERRYNCTALHPSDGEMLHKMRTLGREVVERLLNEGPDTVGSLAWQLQQDGEIELQNPKADTKKMVSVRLVDTDMSSTCKYKLSELRQHFEPEEPS